MYNGVPLVERIKRLIEKQMGILETWADGTEGLTEEQLNQLKTLAMVARQLDLDNVEASAPVSRPDVESSSIDDLIAALPSKK